MALAEAIPSGAAIAALSGRPEVEAGSEIARQGTDCYWRFRGLLAGWIRGDALRSPRRTVLFQAVNVDRRPSKVVERHVSTLAVRVGINPYA